MSVSIYKKVGIAAVIMMASVFLSRLFGLLRLMAIAYVGGRSADVDAYQVAFVIPEILNHIVASGFLSITFIPIFSRYLAKDQEAQGWQVFSIIMTVFGILLLICIVVAHVLTPVLVALLAQGRPDPVFRASVVRMTRIIIPAQFFFFAGGLFMAVQFAKEKFLIPALAPLVYNLGIIAGGILLGPRIGMEGFSWGVLAGALVGNFALQWWGARRVGLKFSVIFDLRHPDFAKYLKMTLPLMLGLTMFFSMEIFIKFFGSFLPAGSIADLEYSLRTMLLLVAFFGQALGVASYPFMARLVVEEKMQQLNDLLNNTLRYLSLVIPVSVLFMVLRKEVILILFQRGKFDAAATGQTASVLIFMLVGSFAFAANTIVPRAYYAMQDTLFPAIYGTVAVLLSIPLYLLGLNIMGTAGVALAASLSAILQVLILYALWNRRNQNAGSRSVYLFYVKMMVFSTPLGVFFAWFKSAVLFGIDTTTLLGSALMCIVTGAAFVLILLVGGYGLKIKEITGFVGKAREKIRRF
ncbi:MAG: murein biosynthesis integral membrane protein MurJ [Desulfobacterales bacterium]|nr:MAG: murein biosynthesis integral membrane protein MurJ [Desulfobacterales bacterium]